MLRGLLSGPSGGKTPDVATGLGGGSCTYELDERMVVLVLVLALLATPAAGVVGGVGGGRDAGEAGGETVIANGRWVIL